MAAFLRDPGSGRVYRRGKLIGKVGVSARAYTHPSSKRGKGESWKGRGLGGNARAMIGTSGPLSLGSGLQGGWRGGNRTWRAVYGRVRARVSRALSIPWVHNWCSTRNGEAVIHAPLSAVGAEQRVGSVPCTHLPTWLGLGIAPLVAEGAGGC